MCGTGELADEHLIASGKLQQIEGEAATVSDRMPVTWERVMKTSCMCAVLLTWFFHQPASEAAAVPDLSGIYWATEYNAKIQIVGGGELPMTPAGKAAYAKNMQGLKDGSIKDEARRLCVPDGLPRVLATPYPFEIVQG